MVAIITCKGGTKTLINKRAQGPLIGMSVHKVREKYHAAYKTALMMDLTALSIRLNMKLISNKKIF